MKTIDITEAKEWKQTLIDVAQSLQDKAAIQGELSEWDKRVYNEVVEIEKKLDSIEQKESKNAEEILQKYIQTEDDEQRPFPYVRPSLALKAMEEYRQQPVIDLREELIKFKDWAVNESRNNALDIDEYLKTKQP